jgi:hypothetical protein
MRAAEQYWARQRKDTTEHLNFRQLAECLESHQEARFSHKQDGEEYR